MQTAGMHFGRFGRAKAHVCKKKKNTKETLLSLQNACWLNELNDCDQTFIALQSAPHLKHNTAGCCLVETNLFMNFSLNNSELFGDVLE